jgi:hypothetical protein
MHLNSYIQAIPSIHFTLAIITCGPWRSYSPWGIEVRPGRILTNWPVSGLASRLCHDVKIGQLNQGLVFVKGVWACKINMRFGIERRRWQPSPVPASALLILTSILSQIHGANSFAQLRFSIHRPSRSLAIAHAWCLPSPRTFEGSALERLALIVRRNTRFI